MKVRMIAQISGTRDGIDWPAPGGTVDVPKDEALELIRGGLATTHDDREVVEQAVPAEGDVQRRVQTVKKVGAVKPAVNLTKE